MVDKTGTLTEGKPHLAALVPVPGQSENEILRLAASLERSSEHPLAAAIVGGHALRRLGLEGTELAKAQCDTIRLKLFKIGAQIRVSVRKVWISFSESYPYLNLFQQVFARLQQISLRC